jgi:porin
MNTPAKNLTPTPLPDDVRGLRHRLRDRLHVRALHRRGTSASPILLALVLVGSAARVRVLGRRSSSPCSRLPIARARDRSPSSFATIVALFVALVLGVPNAWGKEKRHAAPKIVHHGWERGLSFLNHLDLESVSNLGGGLARGTTASGLWEGTLALRTGRAGWWRGGRFLVEGLASDSGEPDVLYIGDLQGVSNITTPYPHVTRLFKAYYRQRLDPYTLRLGLIDPNDYFNTLGVASDLLNASYGIVPTISVNIPYTPTYPYSSLGATLSATAGTTVLRIGVFGADGVRPFRDPWGSDGLIYYGEVDERLPAGPGTLTLKAGGYDSRVRGPYLTEEINIGPAASQGGLYGAAEYRWKNRTGPQWGAFLEGSDAPNTAVSPVNTYLGAGLRLRRFVPASPRSTLSLGMARARAEGGGVETSLEVDYRQPLGEGLLISPDLQYVINPGANAPDHTVPNAWVGIVRLIWRYAVRG